jgi:hypothetical protein
MPELFRKKENGTSQKKNLVMCTTFNCSDKAIGRFKPDSRTLCIEHGSKYSRNWAEDHKNVTGLLGIIVQ